MTCWTVCFRHTAGPCITLRVSVADTVWCDYHFNTGRQAAEFHSDGLPCHPQVGLVMGAAVEANRLVDQLRAQLRGIVAAVCLASHPRTLVLQGLKPFTLGAATSGAGSHVRLCLLAIYAARLHHLA